MAFRGLFLLSFVWLSIACGSTVVDHRSEEGAAERDDGAWCSVDGFCWVIPRPQGNGLAAIHGAGDRVVAVGDHGTALRLVEGAWERVETGTTDGLSKVWVAGDGVTWMGVGSLADTESYLLRVSGEDVVRIDLPNPDEGLAGLHGLGAAVVVAQRHAVYRRRGEAFEVVFATPEDDLEIVDVLVTSSSVWVLTATPWVPDGPLPTTVLFEVEAGGSVERTDAEAHTTGLAELGDGEVVAFGYGVHRVRAGALEEISGVRVVGSAWGASLEDLWLVADDGTYHGDELLQEAPRYQAIWGDATRMVRVGDRGATSVWNGLEWVNPDAEASVAGLATLDPATFEDLPLELWVGDAVAAWASSPTDVWRIGPDEETHTLEHWDGQGWTPERHASSLSQMHGSASNDVWVLSGARDLLRYDGATWTEVERPADAWALRDVWASAPGDAYVVGRDEGDRGVLWRWNGAEWSVTVTLDDADMTSVHGGLQAGEVVVVAQTSEGDVVMRQKGAVTLETALLPGAGPRPTSLVVDGQGIRLLRGHELLERRHGTQTWTTSDVGFRPWGGRVWRGSSGTWVFDSSRATRRR